MSDQPRVLPALDPQALEGIRDLSQKAPSLAGKPANDEALRQQKIDELRAQHREEFDRIEELAPDLDELLSTMIQPPREWLDEG